MISHDGCIPALRPVPLQQKAKARKKKMREEKEEFQVLKSEVADMKNLLVEISRKLGDTNG